MMMIDGGHGTDRGVCVGPTPAVRYRGLAVLEDHVDRIVLSLLDFLCLPNDLPGSSGMNAGKQEEKDCCSVPPPLWNGF